MGQFGGRWTEQKLSAVKQYLNQYAKVMKNQNFTLWYVDAFAGKGFCEYVQGSAPIFGDDEEAIAFVQGSPLNALAVRPAFDHCVFIEQSKAHALSLKERIRMAGSHESKVYVENDDANTVLARFCAFLDKPENGKHRGVIFLDPFATQVRWETVEKLGRTGKLDVWILFPVMAVNRLITNDRSKQLPDWEARLDSVFGVTDWRTAFYKKGESDLFGGLGVDRKSVTFDGICAYYLDRLRSAYGAVVPEYKELRNSSNSPIFALLFAVASQNPKAQGIARNIATHIIKNL